MKKIIYIYGLLNPLNDSLFYIGFTNKIERRLNEHKKSKYNPHKEKIIKEIIDSGNDIDIIELDRTELIWNSKYSKYDHDLLEIKWIKRAKELGNDLTNMTSGGNGLSETGKINIFQYNENGDFLKKYNSLTEAAEENGVSIPKISLALDQKINKSSKGFYWFTSKDLGNKFKFKKTNKNNIKIVAYDLNGNLFRIFNSQSQAERDIGIKSRQINKCLKQESKKRAGKYQWFYYDEKSPQKINKWIDPNLKPVIQFTKNGDFVKEYKSIKEASLENNIDSTGISKCCTGKTKIAYGYVWKHK